MRTLPLAAALLAITAVGCKKAPDPVAPATPPATTAPAAPAVDPNAVVDNVTIEGNDQMQYSVNAFTVKAGSQVTVTLRNVGQLPKNAMGHNFVLLNSGSDVKTYAEVAFGAATTDYIPANPPVPVIAHTKLLGPGESDTITFTAPTAGQYPYLCSFPGHYGVMQGVMTVVD